MELWVLARLFFAIRATGAMLKRHIRQIFFLLVGCSRMYKVGDL